MPQYWINLYTLETWNEYRAAGSQVACFRESMWAKAVVKFKKGDLLLAYVTGLSRFVGIQEVVGDPYQDTTKIYESDVFPSCLPVRPVLELSPECGIPIKEFLGELTLYDLKRPHAWTGRLRGSPTK